MVGKTSADENNPATLQEQTEPAQLKLKRNMKPNSPELPALDLKFNDGPQPAEKIRVTCLRIKIQIFNFH